MTDWHDTRSAAGRHGGNTAVEMSSAVPSLHADPQFSRPVAGNAGAKTGKDGDVRERYEPGPHHALAASSLAVRKLMQILELVRDIPGGTAVYREAVRVLDDLQRSCTRAEQYYSELLDLLLRDQSERCARGTDAHTEFELLRRQLRPPMVPADTAVLRTRLETLLHHQPAGQGPGSAAASFPGANGSHGNSTAQHDAKIDGLQESLGREIRETLVQNEEFGVTLDLVLSELQRVREIGDAELVRERLLEQVKRLHSGHFALAQKLDSADRYLSMLTLDSRHLNEELHRVRELSLTDELTSLPNRRAFMARVEEEVARVERYGMPLSLAIIDLDRFKRINDEHGHAAGDEVLRCYATQIFSVFRNHDLVARYGGEEFAVLLPNTDQSGVAAALRKARESVARLRCRAEDTAFPVPSFSAGVATFQRGETPQRLIDRADEALYRAKRGGRDRVEFADEAKT